MVLEDLRRTMGIIASNGGAELDPQFRLATPEGDYWLRTPLAADPVERVDQMRKLSLLM